MAESIDPVGHLRGGLYQVLAESAPDAIITIDADSIILSVNPAVERLFGYPSHEIVGQPLSVLMPERLRGAHYAGFARYLGTGVRHISWQNIRLPILTKAGIEVPVEISFGEFTAEGQRFFSGFLRDVSDRVAAEHALTQARHESEARATEAERLAVQLQEQAVELEQQTEEAQALAEELEQANDELQGAVLRAELAGARTAVALDTLSGTVEALRRSEERYRALAEASVRREAGTRFLVDAGVALAESRGERSTLDVVAKLAIDGLADGCMVTLLTDDGAFEHVATRSRVPGVAELVVEMERRYPLPADAMSWHPLVIRTGRAALVPERAFDPAILRSIAHNAEHLEQIRRIGMYSAMIVPLAARGRTLGAMTLVLHGPGRRAPFDLRDLAVASELAQRAGLAIDNTRAYGAERVAREEAEFANRARSDFLATMSHELRTPLNAIAGYVDLMELGLRGAVTQPQLQDLARIRRNQQRLLSLVNDVLSFATIDAGQVTYKVTDVPLDQAIADVEALVLPQLSAKSIAYTFEHPACALRVRADRERLEQILLNLLANAIKFTEAGGTVTVTCESGNEYVLIHVCDTGIGIPEDKIDAIFDPFVQVESGHTRSAEGTGLGLAISRELAAGMGATVTVRSEVGAGSTFTVTLPRSESPASI